MKILLTAYIFSHKIYINFSLDITGSKIEIYRKHLQSLYKTIHEVNSIAMIIKYKSDNDKEEITERNVISIAVKAKNSLMNYTEAIPKYL